MLKIKLKVLTFQEWHLIGNWKDQKTLLRPKIKETVISAITVIEHPVNNLSL